MLDCASRSPLLPTLAICPYALNLIREAKEALERADKASVVLVGVDEAFMMVTIKVQGQTSNPLCCQVPSIWQGFSYSVPSLGGVTTPAHGA